MRPRLEQTVLPATEPERDDLLYQEPEQINLRTADQGKSNYILRLYLVAEDRITFKHYYTISLGN